MATGRAAKWWTWRRFGATWVAFFAVAVATASPALAQTHVPSQGPGGPILVVAAPGDAYYAEILRAEGLNEFTMAQPGSVTAQSLAAYEVVIVSGGSALSDAQVAALTQWVQAGG